MSEYNNAIRIRVDVTNPGQFFACCGLLELADRLYPQTKGWFCRSASETYFHLSLADELAASKVLNQIAACEVSSTLSTQEIARLKALLNLKKTLLTSQVEREKAWLSEKWGRERITLKAFGLEVDWWLDEHSGSTLKTWAGKQFVTDIIEGNLKIFRAESFKALPLVDILNYESDDGNLPFYFDATIGGHSSSIDVGFSLDALKMRGRIKPAVEFLAFVGLQRFRPSRSGNTFRYRTWDRELTPILAAAVSSGGMSVAGMQIYEFSLLYRTKYLKAFLSSKLQTKTHIL